MSKGNPPDRDRDYEIPCEMLEPFEIDASAHLTPEERARIPVGGFERCETILETMEFDCAPPVALVLTVRLAEGVDPQVASRELAELLCALNDCDMALGGRGLMLDRAGSRSADGAATVVLLPLDVRSAPERLRQIAELLGGSGNNAHPATTTEKVKDDLIENVALSVAQRPSPKGDPTTARQRVKGWRSGQTVVAGIHAEVRLAA